MGRDSPLRPSPAMVVAIVALVVATAGTAIAGVSKLPGKNSVESSDIDNGSVAKKDLELSQQTAWAVVRADGAVTAANPSAGKIKVVRDVGPDDTSYIVTFPGAVHKRPIAVTPRGLGAEAHPNGYYDVKGRPVTATHELVGDNRSVLVQLHADPRRGEFIQPAVAHGFVIVVLPK